MFAALDNAVEETAAYATCGVAAALAESALLCHVEHARDPFLHGSPVLLIVTHAESDSCALYLMDCRAWPIFRELLGCSIPCLREHVGRHCIRASSPRAFSRLVRSALAAAHTYRRTYQVPCALPERPFRLAYQPFCCFSGPVCHDGLRLQFVPAMLDHCIQHNLPLWA